MTKNIKIETRSTDNLKELIEYIERHNFKLISIVPRIKQVISTEYVGIYELDLNNLDEHYKNESEEERETIKMIYEVEKEEKKKK